MNGRIKYIDVAKGILITMTVFGHIFLKNDFLRNFVYTFHMPAFFIISGILLKSSNKSVSIITFIKKRFISLTIPFLFFELLGVLKDYFCGGYNLNYKGYIFNTLTLRFNNGPDWFLFALFFASIIFYCIYKIFKSDKYRIVFLLFAAGILILAQPFNNHYGEIAVGLLFLTFGYYASALLLMDNKTSVLMAGIITIAISILNGSVDITRWRFNTIPLYLIGSVTGTYFILGLSKALEKKDRLFDYYGKNSLTILGTHNCLIFIIRYYTKIKEFNLVTGISALLFIMSIEIIMINIFNQYIPFLVGKPPYSNNSLLNLIHPNKKQRC